MLLLLPSILPVLIETLWNVKINDASFIFWQNVVLIETLWNVKLFTVVQYSYEASVLIETLWNVKFFRGNGKTGAAGINRNIVECKGVKNTESGRMTGRY